VAIRKMLDISTAHLPLDLRDTDGVWWGSAIKHETHYGFIVWVPDDPEESAKAMNDPPHRTLVRLQAFARKHGCDYIQFDADAEILSNLPTFDEDGCPKACDVDPDTDCCRRCGVLYLDPCGTCGQKGYHADACAEML
jgi:hypothetical protein